MAYTYDAYNFDENDYTPAELYSLMRDICLGVAVPEVKTTRTVTDTEFYGEERVIRHERSQRVGKAIKDLKAR